MALSADQQQAIQLLAAAVSQSSGSFSQSSFRPSADPSGSAERQERADRIRFQQSTKDLKTASKAFDKLADQQNKTADQIKKQVELNSYFISSAIDGLSKLNISPSAFSGLEDLFRDEDRLKAVNKLQDTMEGWAKNVTGFTSTEYKEFTDQLNDVDLSFEELGLTVKRYTDESGNLTARVVHLADAKQTLAGYTEDLSENIKKTTDRVEKLAKTAEVSDKAIKGLTAGLGVAGAMAVQESRLAMERGVAEARTMDGLFDSIHGLKISTSEYMQILGDTRNIQHAINQSGGNFTQELLTSAKGLRDAGFAASAKDAADASTAFMKNVTMMGVRFGELENPLERQKDLYDKHYRALGWNLDQFNQMTEDMLADTDVRNDIARLNKMERQAYVESLQQRVAENIEMGYSIDRAKELNKHFAKISGMNPLERLQKAARERAMMGTLGMAAEGAELQRILVELPSMQEGEGKERAIERATEIRAQAASELKRRRGTGVGAEITFGMLAERLGFKEVSDTFQNEALEGRKFDGDQADKTQSAIGEVSEATKLVVAGVDEFKAAATSSATVLGTIAASWIFSAGMQRGMEGINSKLTTLIAGNALGGGAGGLMGGTIKGAAKGGIIATGFASIAELVASGGERSTLNDMVKSIAPEFEEGLGNLLATVLSDVNDDETKAARAKTNELLEKQNQELVALQRIQMLTGDERKKAIAEYQKSFNNATRTNNINSTVTTAAKTPPQ